MICCRGTAGASVLIWAEADASCRGAFVFAGSAGALEGAAALGGVGKGPCRSAAIGNASTAPAKIKSALIPIFLLCFTDITETTPLILSRLLILIQSLLYLKIGCGEHEFRIPPLTFGGTLRS